MRLRPVQILDKYGKNAERDAVAAAPPQPIRLRAGINF
jgi:hypothetical protein